MKVKIHVEFGDNKVHNLVYLVIYANKNVKIVNCAYFFDMEINQKFDKTETLIRAYNISVLKQTLFLDSESEYHG
jgi:hypothetical protein